MGKLEETLTKGVEEGRIPYAVVFATNSDGSFTYKHAIVEKGLFGLDEDVTSKLSELGVQPILKGFSENDEPILEKRENAITLRHLLTHSSGLAYDNIDPNLARLQEQSGSVPKGRATVAERYTYPLVFEPGSRWMYGPGVDWAGKLIERVTNQNLGEYMRKNIFEPLGITTITFFPYENSDLSSKIPSMAIRTPDGQLAPYHGPTSNAGSTDYFGGHGAYGTMQDYLKVQQSILSNDSKLLRPETVEMMFTPQLSSKSKECLNDFQQTPMAAMLVGENNDAKIDLDWGIGGILFLQDGDGRRKNGTLHWGGMANTFWIIDREADLALTFGTQVLPPGDEDTGKMVKEVELGVYEMAGVKF